jgi:hypothetical protein
MGVTTPEDRWVVFTDRLLILPGMAIIMERFRINKARQSENKHPNNYEFTIISLCKSLFARSLHPWYRRLGRAFLSNQLHVTHGRSALAIFLFRGPGADRNSTPDCRFSQPTSGVIMRQSLWVGVYGATLAWLQIGRVLTLALAVLLALGLIVIEWLLRLRERSQWNP